MHHWLEILIWFQWLFINKNEIAQYCILIEISINLATDHFSPRLSQWMIKMQLNNTSERDIENDNDAYQEILDENIQKVSL